MQKLELIQLFVTSALFGIIWMVQLLQYPSFQFFDQASFKKSMKHHQDSISILIVPLMLLELVVTIWEFNISNLIIVTLIWVITFSIHVPLHTGLLRDGFNEKKIKKLVWTNWSRTILWTLKLFMVFSTSINSL